jgi:hypothetical protein
MGVRVTTDTRSRMPVGFVFRLFAALALRRTGSATFSTAPSS